MAKKKKGKKRNRYGDEREEKKPLFDLSQETKNGIWIISSFAFALLATLSFLDMAGTAGRFFNVFAKTLFGWGFFLVPLTFLFFGISFFRSVSRNTYSSALTGTMLLILSVLGLFFIIGRDVETAERIMQGGYAGLLLGYPLLNFFGFMASFVVLLTLIVIAVLLALDISLPALLLGRRAKEDEEDETSEDLIIKQGSHVFSSRELKEKLAQGALFRAKKIERDRRAGLSKSDSQRDEKKTDEDEFRLRLSGDTQWELPPLEILSSDRESARPGDIAANASIIRRTLGNFGIDVEMEEASVGPTVTQYTLKPAVGVRLSKIIALRSDLSLALAAHPIRIEAPIPGRSLVGLEVPNKKSALVGLRALLESDEFRESPHFLRLAMGRNVSGFPVTVGLENMPHFLIAGATGTGKSVAINSILISLLYQHSPDMLKLIMIDPKRVELSLYNEIPHLITPVIVDVKKSINALKWAVREMEKRYGILAGSGARDILSYNKAMDKKHEKRMPFIIIVIDELADLMVSFGKDIEASVVRLAQMARAVGIHLIVSTQRPSVEVITGVIKANITTRLAFRMVSQVDSRTILDMSGAELLLGNGDALFLSSTTSKPRRLQGALVTEKEVKDVVKFLRNQDYQTDVEPDQEMETPGSIPTTQVAMNIDPVLDVVNNEPGDLLYEDAKRVIIEAGKGSASFLQRRLRVGYARAARLLDMLEENGIIGPADGARPRAVLVQRENTNLIDKENVNMQEEKEHDTLV